VDAGAAGHGPASGLDWLAARPAAAAALAQLRGCAPDAAAFLQPRPAVGQAVRAAAKVLFGLAVDAFADSAGPAAPGLPLGALHVDAHFDAEQVWMQLEVQAAPLMRRVRRLVKRAGGAAALVPADVEARVDGLLAGGGSGGGGGSDDGEGKDDGAGSSDASMSDGSDGGGGGGRRHAAPAKGRSGRGSATVAAARLAKPVKPRGGAAAAVETGLLRLDEMEAFLAEAEAAQAEAAARRAGRSNN